MENLRSNLRKRGSELIVRTGKTKNELTKLVKEEKHHPNFAEKETTFQERDTEEAIASKVRAPIEWF